MKPKEYWAEQLREGIGSLTMEQVVELIQKDAFDSGRVEGIELCMAEIRDRTMYDDKKTAQSIWRCLTNLRDQHSKPKDTTCLKNTP